MNTIYYTKEEIETAREMDLLTYLRLYESENIVRVRGEVYCTREHDSLKISNGKWMWWSRGFGGASALDYLIKVKGLPFKDAMEILSGRKTNPSFFIPQKEREKSKKLLLPERSESCSRAAAYLKCRGISENIIEKLIADGLLYESEPQHSCIFIGKDADGTPRYAAFRACSDEKILGEAAGSDKSWPFRIEAHHSPSLHLFESAIDLLSYATLRQLQDCRWDDENLLSMGGISVSKSGRLPVSLGRFLERNEHIRKIEIHFDRDAPGRNAAAMLMNILKDRYDAADVPPPQGKDFNDYLKNILKQKEMRGDYYGNNTRGLR